MISVPAGTQTSMLKTRPIEGDPDSDILPALMAQDPAAFATLVNRHVSSLCAQAAQMLGDMHAAEDITQSVFIKTWEMLPDWKTDNARLTTWMRRVSTNMCLDYLRKKKPIYSDNVPDLADPLKSAEDRMVHDQKLQYVKARLETLPERQKAALTLFYYQELPHKMCAEIMELTVPAFESLLRRARLALKKSTLEDASPL